MAADGDEAPFRLFSTKPIPKPSSSPNPPTLPHHVSSRLVSSEFSDADADVDALVSFAELGLSQWAVSTCRELGIRRPTEVQRRCIPRILAGRGVLGIAHTGSGKTAAFALPILHRLAEDPYGVFALVLTPTRELAVQVVEQFRALGASLNVRCSLVVGGMDMLSQGRALAQRPHVVVATPGRIKALLVDDTNIPPVFSKTKFLVLDEADRVLDVGFEEELRVIFRCLPRNRQTLLFSATSTSELEALHKICGDSSYMYRPYEGFNTVGSLRQQYIFTPDKIKDVYLAHILAELKEKSIRSAMVFVSTCRGCHLLSLLLEELDIAAEALHSHRSQSSRLTALSRFKSSQVPVLLATDVASRGLDIPMVDLVINYDLPRYARDYVHRVGRTARAGRGGLSISFVTQNDMRLFEEIEKEINIKLDASEYEEKKVLEHISKVFKARRVANMKMVDDGFEEKAKARKEQKLNKKRKR